MNINKIKTYMLSAVTALSLASCLDKYPEDSIPMDDAVTTVGDIDKLVIGIYDSSFPTLHLSIRKVDHTIRKVMEFLCPVITKKTKAVEEDCEVILLL